MTSTQSTRQRHISRPEFLGLAVLLLTCSLHAVDASSPCWTRFAKADYPNCQQLAPTYAVHWNIKSGSINFALSLSAPVTWVGLGLSESGGMKGADIMVLEQTSTDMWQVTDMFAEDYARPVEDPQQDATLVSVKVTNGSLDAVISRPLTTCDPMDFDVSTNGLYQHIIWSFGTSGTLSYHGTSNRGLAQVIFAPPASDTKAADPANTTTLDVFMSNYTVPAAKTTYMCTIVQIPAGPKRHMFRYTPKVDSKLLHHMIVYGCSTRPATVTEDQFECSSMPSDCNTFLLAWAPGQGERVVPADAGYAMGGPGGLQYLALQVHYNNPAQVTIPTPDNSGFKLYLTTTLRKYDVGVLWLGQEFFVVPAKNANYTAPYSICGSNCTSQFPGNLTIIGTFPHMHTAGKSLLTRRFRNGKEIKPLTNRKYWDFNHQAVINPDPSDNVIMPGDTLMTTCTYDTSSRTAATQYGEDSDNEMCYDFVTYYPLLPNKTEVCFGFTPDPWQMCTSRTTWDQTDVVNPTPAQTIPLYMAKQLVELNHTMVYTPYNPTCTATAKAATTRSINATAAAQSPTAGKSPSPKKSAATAPRASLLATAALLAAALLLTWLPA